jgi:hypothetical protein
MPRDRRRGRNGDASLLQPHCDSSRLRKRRTFARLSAPCKTSNTRVMHRQGNEGPMVNYSLWGQCPSSRTGAPLRLNNNPPTPSRREVKHYVVVSLNNRTFEYLQLAATHRPLVCSNLWSDFSQGLILDRALTHVAALPADDECQIALAIVNLSSSRTRQQASQSRCPISAQIPS